MRISDDLGSLFHMSAVSPVAFSKLLIELLLALCGYILLLEQLTSAATKEQFIWSMFSL